MRIRVLQVGGLSWGVCVFEKPAEVVGPLPVLYVNPTSSADSGVHDGWHPSFWWYGWGSAVTVKGWDKAACTYS